MKKTPIILSVVLLALSCQQQEKKETVYNDLFSENLNGEVVSVETTPYKVDSTGKMGDMDSCCITFDEYDNAGYIIKSSQKESTGTLKSQTDFTHFENGRMKEVTETKDGKVDNKLEIQIDTAGDYASATRYDSIGKPSAYYTDLSTSKYGEVLSGTELKPDSTVNRSWKNMYDDRYFVGGESKDSSGAIVFSSVSKVNEKGNRISLNTTSVGKDSTVKKSYTYQYTSYDDHDNWTERTEMENGKPVKIVKRTITYAKKE